MQALHYLKVILYTTESHTWDNNISVKDSTVTSGSNYILDSNTYGKTGHFGNSDEPSDYAGPGDVAFTSTWNSNFDPNGHDSNGDGVKDTNGGWTDDSLQHMKTMTGNVLLMTRSSRAVYLT